MNRVELVEARSEGLEVRWDRVYLTPIGGVAYHPRKVQQLQREGAFLGGRLGRRDVVVGARVQPRAAENAGNAGVGVLDVEDGVLVGLPDRQVEVEVHLR